MRIPYLGVAVLVMILWVSAMGQERAPVKELPPPDLTNVAYGPHEGNVLDLWKADRKTPAPLAHKPRPTRPAPAVRRG